MRHRVTVDELYRIYEGMPAGGARRMELINGEIIDMMPPGPFHSASSSRTNRAVVRKSGDRFIVRCQEPLRINSHNEPQPDIAVVKPRQDDYALSHPGPDDALLIIEISDSSLEFDLNIKRRTYAAAEIAEYWVLDVAARELHAFRCPWQGDYTEHQTCSEQEEVRCTTIGDLKFTVAELLPAVISR